MLSSVSVRSIARNSSSPALLSSAESTATSLQFLAVGNSNPVSMILLLMLVNSFFWPVFLLSCGKCRRSRPKKKKEKGGKISRNRLQKDGSTAAAGTTFPRESSAFFFFVTVVGILCLLFSIFFFQMS
jgi:hypothetical protein